MSVSITMQQCYHDLKVEKTEFIDWIKKWPTQLLLVIMEIQLTNDLKKIFTSHEKRQKKRAKMLAAKNYEELTYLDKKKPLTNELKDVYFHINDQILQLSHLIRQTMAASKRQSVMSLIINRVYCRDKVKRMLQQGIESANEFLWKIYVQYDYVER